MVLYIRFIRYFFFFVVINTEINILVHDNYYFYDYYEGENPKGQKGQRKDHVVVGDSGRVSVGVC